MLEDDSLDAVAVVTPVSTHHDLAMRALTAGKHVFVEKPLARLVGSVHRPDAGGVRARPGADAGPHLPLQPAGQPIRELIHSGELGEIYFISMSRVNLGLHQSDVSVIWDLAPHDFSILLYWLDERPRQVVSMGRACIDGGRGRRVHQLRVWLRRHRSRRIVVARPQQAPPDDGGGVEQDGRVRRLQQRAGPRVRRGGGTARPRVVRRVPQVPHRRHRLASHRSEGADGASGGRLLPRNPFRHVPRSSARLGLDVVRMIEAAERSHMPKSNPCLLEWSASVPDL